MLRLIVLLLVLTNAGYYAWSHGLLAAYGFAPTSQSEPQRLAQQINPEAIRILSPAEALLFENPQPPASAALVSNAAGCLQVGLFNEEQTVVLRERLVSLLPAGSWVLESAASPARWLVYMGKFSSAEAVDKKKAELRGLKVTFDTPNNTALEPGLSLGSFKTQAEADAELARIAQKGVKTARVIQERAEQRGQKLKLPTVNAALRTQLDAIKPQLAGKTFQACS
jgi:hypothetical protein